MPPSTRIRTNLSSAYGSSSIAHIRESLGPVIQESRSPVRDPLVCHQSPAWHVLIESHRGRKTRRRRQKHQNSRPCSKNMKTCPLLRTSPQGSKEELAIICFQAAIFPRPSVPSLSVEFLPHTYERMANHTRRLSQTLQPCLPRGPHVGGEWLAVGRSPASEAARL